MVFDHSRSFTLIQRKTPITSILFTHFKQHIAECPHTIAVHIHHRLFLSWEPLIWDQTSSWSDILERKLRFWKKWKAQPKNAHVSAHQFRWESCETFVGSPCTSLWITCVYVTWTAKFFLTAQCNSHRQTSEIEFSGGLNLVHWSSHSWRLFGCALKQVPWKKKIHSWHDLEYKHGSTYSRISDSKSKSPLSHFIMSSSTYVWVKRGLVP